MSKDYTFSFNNEAAAQNDPFVGQYCMLTDDGDGNMIRVWDGSRTFSQQIFSMDSFQFVGGFVITISLTDVNEWFEQHPNLILKSDWTDGVGTKEFVASDYLPFKDHFVISPCPWGRNVNDLDDPVTLALTAKSKKPPERKTFTLPVRPSPK